MSAHKDGGAYFSGDVTFAADVTINGGVNGSGNVQTVTKIFTDAEIKTMIAYKIVVPATETLNYEGLPSQIFLPIYVYGIFDAAAGAYSGWSGSQPAFLLYWGSDGSQLIGLTLVTTANTPFMDAYSFENGAKKSFYSFVCPNVGFGPGDLQDNSISIVLNNASNLTAGHANNSFTVVASYLVINL